MVALLFFIMTKLFKYFVLPLVVSFSRNRQLKTSNFHFSGQSSIQCSDKRGGWLYTLSNGSQILQTNSYYYDKNAHILFLPLVVSFSRNRQLKCPIFTFPDSVGTDKRNYFQKFLTYINMTHVNFLFHKLLVSETQTDRQDNCIIDIYINIYTHIYIYIY